MSPIKTITRFKQWSNSITSLKSFELETFRRKTSTVEELKNLSCKMKLKVDTVKIQLSTSERREILIFPSVVSRTLDRVRHIWIECYVLLVALIGQCVAIATPYWAVRPIGHSGLWENCVYEKCVDVFEYGDPAHWLRCVQIVICIALPLTVLSGIFMVLASLKTNTNCANPAGFSCLTAGFMILLGAGFYGYQQNELSTIGWSLIVSVLSGCLCVFSSTRMCLGCLHKDTDNFARNVYLEAPVNL